MQASGSGLQMEAGAFQRELEDNPALLKLLLRYSEAMHAQAMQTAACNGRHNLEQRLARWLLMAHDRSEGDALPLTQEFLSLMLCVYRPSITLAARALQKAGIISYGNSRKGNIIILDREALRTPPAIVTRSCRRGSNICSVTSRGGVDAIPPIEKVAPPKKVRRRTCQTTGTQRRIGNVPGSGRTKL